MRKAVIKDSTVINIIETDENGIQGLIMPENQALWDCTQYAVAIGDTFIDGKFYHENEPAEYIPSTEEEVAILKAQNKALNDELSKVVNGTAKALFSIMDGNQSK